MLGGTASKEAVAEKLISVAKEYGFNFTKEEAAVAQSDFKIPLSEDELEEVSGGFLGIAAAVVSAVLGIFAGASFLSGGGQPAPPPQYQMESVRTDVNDEDMDKFHQETLDVQANDEEEETLDEGSEKYSYIGYFNEDSYGNDFDLMKKQLEVEQMNEMRYSNPPTVALSPGGGHGGKDDDELKKYVGDLLVQGDISKNHEKSARTIHEASKSLKLLEELPELKIDVSELGFGLNDVTSDEQIEEHQNENTVSKVDEQKPVEQ